jgi:hypothetical protein
VYWILVRYFMGNILPYTESLGVASTS